jgi:hypothetical protein
MSAPDLDRLIRWTQRAETEANELRHRDGIGELAGIVANLAEVVGMYLESLAGDDE